MSSGHIGGKSSYKKPWISIAEQVQLLERRGLVITDKSAAECFLRHVGYYRLAGYCLAFENPRHTFTTVSIDQIQFAYTFDAKLRDLLTEALEMIEIDLRSSIAFHFGHAYGAFSHTNAANFHPNFDSHTTHAKWLDKLHDETTRSSELFVKHFRTNYNEFPNIPIWAATELMSFGTLSRMISALKKADRTLLAKDYGLAHVVLQSVVHHFAYVRNLCAHHSRLWDRQWSVKPYLPNTADWQPPLVPSNRRVFSTLLLMRYILRGNSHLKTEVITWKSRVEALLSIPPQVRAPLAVMGLTPDWNLHPAWL